MDSLFVFISCLAWLTLFAIPAQDLASTSLTTSPGYLRFRRGDATKTHSCDKVRQVPKLLRKDSNMGLSNYYQKYTEAYNIPIISSSNVPDEALKRACYVMRFLAADHAGIRRAFYKNWGRVGVIATSEQVTSIPEHSHLDPTYWNARARGLGGTKSTPISTAPEENILCSSSDRWYPNQDIMVHELNHGIHLLGAADAIQGWDKKLKDLYYRREEENDRWTNTYSMSTYLELFSEGAQSYFHVNSYSEYANGREGPTNTRQKLKEYDLPLYSLIKQVFPCGNTILDRCNTTRELENAQVLKMDCEYVPVQGVTDEDFKPIEIDEDCFDDDEYCKSWSNLGYCTGSYEAYMTRNCIKSCDLCVAKEEPTEGDPDCFDSDVINCPLWASQSYCNGSIYESFMTDNCTKSCGRCMPPPNIPI